MFETGCKAGSDDHHKIEFDCPVDARYIKILPVTWNNHISLRAGLCILDTNTTVHSPVSERSANPIEVEVNEGLSTIVSHFNTQVASISSDVHSQFKIKVAVTTPEAQEERR